MNTKKYMLEESEIPKQWYNIVADMPHKPQPMLNPLTKKPVTAEELYPLFAKECINEELNEKDAFIEIPEQVREQYKIWRPTPLVRAYGLEKALDTPAHIYFKNESVSPVGSHKLNSALAQVYFAKQDGVTNLTTETGAGQWGTAMSYACHAYGIELAVFMVKVSYEQKPYRRSMMKTFGAQVIASPSMSTSAGRKILTNNPNHQGSLGTAVSEAVDFCRSTPEFCKYAIGSTMNHVMLHQTIIGEEARLQMEKAGEWPDVVIACFGGGSNFAGISFPFLRDVIRDGKKLRAIAVEPASCPKFSQGKFEYDYGDEAGYTPLIPMFTLGHDFVPSNTHAGGLRYHGSGAIPSQLKKDGLIEVADVGQLEAFDAAVLFARSEGIIPAPESSHAIAVAVREARIAKERGEKKNILFNLSGHGWIDMAAYELYFSGSMKD